MTELAKIATRRPILRSLIEELEKGLREFVIQHGARISFTQAQYTIEERAPDIYVIKISPTGFGTQHIQIKVVNEEFEIRSSANVTPEFPSALVATFISGVVTKALSSEGKQPLVDGPSKP